MTTSRFDHVRGVLFDLDGVVHVDYDPIDGAARTLQYLREKQISFCFVTNTTTIPPRVLHEKMLNGGLQIDEDLILTAHEAASAYLAALGGPSCFLLVADSALPAYDGIPLDEMAPKYVVIGDIGERWNYSLLNRVFNMVMDGAEMIALHKGRYWQTGGGLRMDIGAFVLGLEYTTGKTAHVIGKPSPAFFEMAHKHIGLSKDETIMIGDDIETDVGGAQAAGIRGVLVKTGKYRDDTLARSNVEPDAILDSIAELPRLLQRGKG